MEEGKRRELPLTETPSWAVATVVFVMVALGFTAHAALKHFGKWLHRTKRKPLFAALDKMKEELMLFGLLSLIMGHWTVVVAKICVDSSTVTGRFYPCAVEHDIDSLERVSVSNSNISAFLRHQVFHRRDYCPPGQESFVSYESLEQLHRLIFVLGVTHVFYSFVAISLAMIKIYSWRTWESQAQLMAHLGSQGFSTQMTSSLSRVSTFVSHHTSHPWSQHRVLVWLLSFSRQLWSSISRADYMALRLGFVTTHGLPLSYDFLNYMLRSMEEEFRDIVGIRVKYLFLGFLHSFYLVKMAVEIMDMGPYVENLNFKLSDEFFWFGKPRLLLRLIQLVSFLNAFEMATFIWSLWEIQGPSCFMKNLSFLVIRLIFGVISQFWCSFITFPLYVIITQMSSRVKKSVIAKDIRTALHGWQRRAKAKYVSSFALSKSSTLSASSRTLDSSRSDNFADFSIKHRSIDEGLAQLSQNYRRLRNSSESAPALLTL